VPLRTGNSRPVTGCPHAAVSPNSSPPRAERCAAYAMLAGEGYVVSRGPAGTIVSPDLAAPSFVRVAARPRPSTGREAIEAGQPRPFQMGLPALDAFPRKLWAHLVGRQARRFSSAGMIYPDPAGSKLLQQAIAGYLATSRGINCTWHQVLITHGYQAVSI
jgi:GntR family transcriptional regulator / MocR family aminotransferase